MGKNKVTSEFNPDITNPYYFMRLGIYQGIRKHSDQMQGRILDFGCGSKPYASLFQFKEYIGVDLENPGHPHDNEEIDIYYDGQNIPLEDGTVDSVLCSEVFEHVFNLPDILKEFQRLLKPGGVLLATCPFVWKEHELPYDYARYTLYALDDLMVSNGFKKVEASKGGNFAEVLTQLTVLFFYDLLYGKANRFWLTRKIYTLLFIIAPNLFGILVSKVFKKQTQMYLNNIILYKKV